MKSKKQLSILEFSRLSGINRDNLRYYDRIGLLSPENRGENRYRYYSRQQLNSAYLIISLRGMGVGIEEIKQFVTERTPEKTIALFDRQDVLIQEKVKELHEVREITKLYKCMMQEALSHKENVVFLENKTSESIFLCPSIPSHMSEDEGEIFSYEQAEANGINSGFPLGVKLTQNINEDKLKEISYDIQYYFKAVKNGNDIKPAGLYAVIYGWIDQSRPMELYKVILDYIHEHNLEICSNVYEEYPFGGFSMKDTLDYYARIEIAINTQ